MIEPKFNHAGFDLEMKKLSICELNYKPDIPVRSQRSRTIFESAVGNYCMVWIEGAQQTVFQLPKNYDELASLSSQVTNGKAIEWRIMRQSEE